MSGKRNHRCPCGWLVPECLMLHIDGKSYSSLCSFIDPPGFVPKNPSEGKEAPDVFCAYECPQCGHIMGDDMMHGSAKDDIEELVHGWRATKTAFSPKTKNLA